MKVTIACASILAMSASAFPFSELFARRESRNGIIGRDNIRYNRDCNATGYVPWACKTCNNRTINDETKTAEDKWTATDGDAGWDHIKSWWTVLNEGGKNPDPLGAVSGFVQSVPIFKNRGNDHGWAKVSANAAVANSVTLAKDSQPGVQGQMNTLNDIRSELGTLVDGWADVTQKYLTDIFSGSDGALTQLDAYVKDGYWDDTQFDNNLFGLQGIMENVLYGQLIPKAWSEQTEVHPVVVFQGADNVSPLTPLLQGDASRTLSDNDAKAPRTQYGGTTLWLLDAHDCINKEPTARGGSGNCNDPFVKPLPGAPQLTGGNWGVVLVDDITISAFTPHHLNASTNNYLPPSNSRFTSTSQSADCLFQAGIRTPGFFSVPVCDISTVFDVAVRDKGNEGIAGRCASWPCC